MGDLILGPAVDSIVSKVIDAASGQLNLVLEWKDDLTRFCLILEMIRGMLQDADEKHLTGHSNLKPWLRKLRDLADEADDVLGEVTYENLRIQLAVQKPWWKKVCYFFTPSNPLVFRMKMANRVKNLNLYFTDINDWGNRLGLQYKLSQISVLEPIVDQQTHSFLGFSDPSHVVGRDTDVTKIVNLLTDSSSQQQGLPLPVITICGMAGLGKTTVAKKVFATDKIVEHFDKKIWVWVSTYFDVERILKQMLESVIGGACGDMMNKDALVRRLIEELGEKRTLLVLDDVWNNEGHKWEELRRDLLGIIKFKGSRVMVTTRSDDVALLMSVIPAYIHKPEKLDYLWCWTIIKQRAFGTSSAPKELEGVGKEISRKCKGVPLAATVIGAALQNRRNEDEWKSITNSNAWDSIERERGIINVLKLSFDRLPELSLKQCFAFCSIFPKGFVLERNLLIQLWMAGGFLQPSGDDDMEMHDVGNKHFNDLLSYSLFQDEERDSKGNITSCKMHDLIHDLAKSLSKSEMTILETLSARNISNIRHLNLIYDGEIEPAFWGNVAKKLQTLFSRHGFTGDVEANFRRLQILSLRGAETEQVPTCFRNSKQLRYLDISETRIKELPKFITKLYNLQTLRFMNCGSLQMPAEGIGNLINLRHIYFNNENCMPANIGRLTCLQTLQIFFVGKKSGFRIEELGDLNGLKGRLAIHNLEHVKDRLEAMEAKLHKKAIDQLSLLWGKAGNHDNDVSEGLQPPPELRSLTIKGYGGKKLPSWLLNGSEFLEELHIESCPMLESAPISGLSKLQKLCITKCRALSSIGSLSACKGLKDFYLEACPNLTYIPSMEGLTFLQKLSFIDCNGLECLPNGLLSCPALDLEIWKCPNMFFLPKELQDLLA